MKAKFGALVVEGRGKLNGWVASRNRAGAYFRTKVSPVNPQSTNQLTVRERLGTISQAWKLLTDPQRASWNMGVGNWARTDIFGDLRNPSGFNLYQRLNNNAAAVDEGPFDVAPEPSTVSTVDIVSVIPDESTQLIPVVMSGAVPANTALKVFATAPQSVGKTFVKSEYRLLTFFPAAQASPLALGASYVARFGAFAQGTRLFFKFVFVNTDTGQESLPIQISALPVA